jgi:hypothetical protein
VNADADDIRSSVRTHRSAGSGPNLGQLIGHYEDHRADARLQPADPDLLRVREKSTPYARERLVKDTAAIRATAAAYRTATSSSNWPASIRL